MRIGSLLLGLVGLGCFAVACTAAPVEEEGVDDLSALTPSNAASLFEQVKTCDGHVRFKIGVRDSDLAGGVVRWKCGDVDGVDLSDGRNDFGQEYCEYHALVKGAIVDETSDPPEGDVKCVYSSIFSDSRMDTTKIGDSLKSEMSLSSAPELSVIKMARSVNSRNAARVLIDDCAGYASEETTNAERQSACFAATKTADATKKAQLRKACSGVDLSNAAAWRAVQDLGVKDLSEMEAGAEVETLRDIAYCAQSYDLVTKKKPGAVVLWRNSDPTICGRILRAAKECGDTFKPLTDVTTLDGFSLTSWNDDNDPKTAPQVPVAGCKFAEVDGAPNPLSLVCTPPKTAVAQAKLDSKPMQFLCNELFGGEIAMAAPIGAISVAGTKTETPFCKAFHEGARAIGGGAK